MYIDFSKDDKDFVNELKEYVKIVIRENKRDVLFKLEQLIPEFAKEVIWGRKLYKREKEIHLDHLETYGKGMRRLITEVLSVRDSVRWVRKNEALSEEAVEKLYKIESDITRSLNDWKGL